MAGSVPLTAALTLAIAVAWVGVAQLARKAELSPACGGGGLGAHSCAHFIVWLNGSCWVFLALPYGALRAVQCSKQRCRTAGAAGQGGGGVCWTTDPRLHSSEVTLPQLLVFFTVILPVSR